MMVSNSHPTPTRRRQAKEDDQSAMKPKALPPRVPQEQSIAEKQQEQWQEQPQEQEGGEVELDHSSTSLFPTIVSAASRQSQDTKQPVDPELGSLAESRKSFTTFPSQSGEKEPQLLPPQRVHEGGMELEPSNDKLSSTDNNKLSSTDGGAASIPSQSQDELVNPESDFMGVARL